MIHTRGNVVVDQIKVGDIHYEFDYGVGIKVEVTSLPVRDSQGCWTWTARNVNSGKEVHYGVREGYEHYASKLYNYEAYHVYIWI